MPQYRPDTKIKFTCWTTQEQKELVDSVCRRWEAFEADVLRYTLEAMVPIAARDGLESILTARHLEELLSPEARKRPEQFPNKLTVRTSARILDLIRNKLVRRKAGRTEAAVLRYAFAAGLPLALKHGLSYVLAMREQNLKLGLRARRQ